MLQYFDNTSILILFISIFLLGFIFIVITIVLKTLQGKSRRIYKQKGPYLLSPGEKRFFDALIKVIQPSIYVCPKVRIADIVEVDISKDDKEFWPKFNKISQKHVDFVICSRTNFAPLLIIELDGGSHNEKSQSLRDATVDNVFKDAQIPILHIKPSNFYEYKTLRENISQAINKN
jgi:hypothetical protein